MKKRNGYTFKSVILCVLFIAIVVCISIWIFMMRSQIRKDNKLIESAISESKSNVSTNSDKEFSKNIKKIKEAALKYFDSETLPKEVGSSSKITLSEMIEKKLIDKIDNQSKYDLDGTYVKVTKTSNEYVVKVYLKGVKKSNYNIYYYGNYDYCLENTVCEKNEKGSSEYYFKVSESDFSSNSNSSISDASNGNSSSASSLTTSKSASSSSYTYKASSSSSTSNNNTSKSRGTKKVKTTTTTTVSKGSSKKKTTITTKITKVVKNVVNTIKTEFTSHTKNESKEENKKDKECKDEDIYEYHKSTSGTSDYTNWSDWTKNEIKPTATREVQKKTTKKLVAYKITTSKDTSKPIYKEKDVVIGYKNTKTCTTYNEITTTTTTKTTRTISASSITSGNTESIVRTGDSSYGRNNGYKLVNTYDYYCGEVCVHGTTYVFKKDVKVPVNTTSTTSSGTVKTEYVCTNYETYQTPVIGKRKVIVDYENKEEKEPVYEYNYYYRYRDIKKTKGSSDTKWSYYNDKTLLDNGYKYTGNKKTNTICK